MDIKFSNTFIRYIEAKKAIIFSSVLMLALVTYAILVASSIEAIKEWITNSDQLTVPSLIIDLIRDPKNIYGWQLSRSSFLFPDALSYYLALLIFRDPYSAILAASAPILLLWVYLVFQSTFSFNNASLLLRCLWVSAFGVLLPLVMAQYFESLTQWIFKYFFSFSNHFSCFVVSLILLLWSVRYLRGGSRILLISLAVIVTLMSSSNRASWVYFLLPAFFLVTLLSLFKLSQYRQRLIKFSIVAPLSVAFGFFIEQSFNRIEAMPYQLSLASYVKRVSVFVRDISTYITNQPVTGIYIGVIVAIYLIATVILFRDCRSWRRGCLTQKNEEVFLWQASILFGGFVNIPAAIMAWEAIGSARYLMFFFFAPTLLLSLVAHNFNAIKPILISLVLCITCSLLGLSLYDLYQNRDAVCISLKDQPLKKIKVQKLAQCIKKNGLHHGLANYWLARPLTFISHGELQIDQLVPWRVESGGNLLFYWGNNAFSFLSDHYDFLIVNGLDKSLIRDSFGVPDQIVDCGHYELWVYRDQTKLFQRLMQGHAEIYQRLLLKDKTIEIPAGIFRSQVGVIHGLTRLSRPPNGGPGYLIFGNYFLMGPGTYRFTAQYDRDKEFPAYQATPGNDGSYFEVGAENGKLILKRAPLNQDEKYPVAFTGLTVRLENKMVIEPRIYVGRTSALSLEAITITKID